MPPELSHPLLPGLPSQPGPCLPSLSYELVDGQVAAEADQPDIDRFANDVGYLLWVGGEIGQMIDVGAPVAAIIAGSEGTTAIQLPTPQHLPSAPLAGITSPDRRFRLAVDTIQPRPHSA